MSMPPPPPPSDRPPPGWGGAPGGPPPPPPMFGAASYAPYGQPPKQGTSGMAIAGFVLSLVALVPCFWVWFQLPGVLAIVFSALGMRATRHGARPGRGLAIAGLVVGIIAVAIAAMLTIYVYTSDDCDTDGFQISCSFDGN